MVIFISCRAGKYLLTPGISLPICSYACDTLNQQTSVYLPVSQWSTAQWFSVAPRHICRSIDSSDVTFFRFIALPTSFSHFISDRPRRHLPPGDQVFILFKARSSVD